MIRRRLLIALLATGLVGPALAEEPAASPHPERLGFSAERLGRISEVYRGYVERRELPGAVLLIARGDEIAYFEAIGFADREKQIPMRKDSIFRLASMTKPIVSTAIMMLVEEGKIDLAAPVSQYLPELADVKVGVEEMDAATGKPALKLETPHRAMTVQDLLRHTSGFVYGQFGDHLVHHAYRDAGIGNRGDSLAEFVSKLSALPLAHHPGEVWEYSVSVDVLGRIVEVVSGMELNRFIAERITGPLGMTATDFYVHEANWGRLAEPQAAAGTGERPRLFDATKEPRFLSGGGGMVASTGDYLRFAEMLLNGGAYGGAHIVSPHTIALMTADALPPGIAYAEIVRPMADIAPTPEMGQGFGLGFAVRKDAGHNPLPGSIGVFYWVGAFGTSFWVDPQERLIAIQMIQVSLPEGARFRRAFRELVYQAMTGKAG